MNRPWFVRSVALLLVLAGLQAGSFQDLHADDEPYYGSADYSAAVRPEARESDALALPEPAANPPGAIFTARNEPATRVCASAAIAAPRFRLHATGPPRA